jgi:hypothetical protein
MYMDAHIQGWDNAGISYLWTFIGDLIGISLGSMNMDIIT